MKRILTGLVALLIGAAPAIAADDLTVERVVILMRHGVRPPTNARVTPPGIAAQDWPAQWSVPLGHLTVHGREAIRLLGAFDRAQLGSLFPQGCPAAGSVVVYSDFDERTISTGDAMIEGLFPGCSVANAHKPEKQNDPLFHPYEGPNPPKLDAAKAKAAILAAVGSLEAVRAKNKAAFDKLGDVLGCCSVKVCTDAKLQPGCKLADLPGGIADELHDGRPEMTGVFDFAPSAAQTLQLEYTDGHPMNEVGWGRAGAADITLMMSLHSMKGDLEQRPPYVGAPGATPLARRMLEALDSANGPKLTVLVGHDTNIGDMSGLLGFTWQVPGYSPNTPPPGGGFALELTHDAAGTKYVRAFYRSQSLDQMRSLQKLDAAHPGYRKEIHIPGCEMPGDQTRCTLATFKALVMSKAAP